MATSLSVTVIIPAYNAEKFVARAIKSTIYLTQVKEVIVVDDGSTDETWRICKEFSERNTKIKVLQHQAGKNLGRSASRNLGIRNASAPFISFLDADDFYLPNRFDLDETKFEEEGVDGVYNAVGFHFYRPPLDTEYSHYKISTINKQLKPNDLFEGIIASKNGYLHLNGLTLKKFVFKKIGLFNENLMVAEDSLFIFKLALELRLHPSSTKIIVANRGIHYANIFNNEKLYDVYTLKMYESLIAWILSRKVSISKLDATLDALWIIIFRKNKSLFHYTYYWLKLLVKFPQLIPSKLSIKYFPIVRLRKKLLYFFYN